MFDVGFSELLLFAIVALVVLGPEKLPHAARIAGAWVSRVRRTVSNMQAEIEREVMAQEFQARMDKELKSMDTTNLMQEIKAETRAIETSFNEVQSTANDALAAHRLSGPDSTDMSTRTTNTDVASPDLAHTDVMSAPGPSSSLADVATPLDQVDMDGEKAYREWLAAQKKGNAASSATATEQITRDTSSDTSVDQSPS